MYESVQLYSKNVCNIAYHTIVVKEHYPCVLAISVVCEASCFAFKKKGFTQGKSLTSLLFMILDSEKSHLQRYFHRDNNITFEQGTGCSEFYHNFYSSNEIGL